MATSSQINRGGIVGRGNYNAFHTGFTPATTTTMGTDTTPVITETYISSVYIPENSTVTNISILNGSAVSGNVKVALADFNGNVIGQSASTSQSGTAAYQTIALASPVDVLGPGVYYIMLQVDNTTARFRSWPLGVFPTQKQTSQTYGTFTNFTPATTFTATVGPIASVS